MLLSAMSVLVVAQSSSEIPEGLMNNPVYVVESRFVTVSFTTIHLLYACRVGPSTSVLWCITVATQASFLYLVRS